MFNQPADKHRQSNYDGDASSSSFGFSNHAWNRFGMDSAASLSNDAQQSSHVSQRSFASSIGMDWMPTPSAAQANFQPQQQQQQQQQYHHHHVSSDNVELDDMSPPQGGGGVGRLVAHFENKGFAPPPLPPRPSTIVTTPSANLNPPPISPPFVSFDASVPRVASPAVTSPVESTYGQFGGQPRFTSPFASPPPMAFGGFHDVSRVSSPMEGPSSGFFGNMDQFMNNPMASPEPPTPTMSSPPPATPGVPGTPGFSIWRPPVPMTPKPVMQQQAPPNESSNQGIQSSSNNLARSSGYFRPPVPSTPKPIINISNQFILELNPGVKAKGKAPARPPSRQPNRQASRPSISDPAPIFSRPIKQENATPQPDPSPTSFVTSPTDRRSSVSLRTQAASRASREQVPAEAWESLKATIRSLYLEERKPLKEVMSIMAEKYGFQATPKMYKTRFSQWGFVKNNTEDEVKRLLSMKFQRDAEGKVSEFVRNGKVVNLGTYLKRKGVTEYDLVDFELPADLPAHIRCRTPTPPPEPGYLRSPDLLRAQEIIIGNMRKAFLHCRQFEVDQEAQVGWQTTMIWGAGSSDLLLEANSYFEMRDADQGGQYLGLAFKELESDLNKLTPQGIKELLLGMVHRDPGMMTMLCKYLAAYSSTNFDRSHPLRQIFACLYEVQQKHGSMVLSDLLWGSIPTIVEELEAIYGRRHPYVARAWTDLAYFYNHINVDRLEKLSIELGLLQRQMEHRQGHDSVDVLILRYAIVQLLYAVDKRSIETRQAVTELWQHAKNLGYIFPVRDQRPNVYCYHSPVKVSPWTKRCRRRYQSGAQIFEEILGVYVMTYFEEDLLHETVHLEIAPSRRPGPSAQDSLAAAVEFMGGSGQWAFK